MLRVDTQMLDAAASTLESISAQLENVSSKLSGSAVSQAGWILLNGTNAFGSKLKSCGRNVGRLGTSSRGMKEALSSVSALYAAAERRNCGLDAGSANEGAKEKSPTIDWKKWIFKGIGTAGPAGTFIGSVLQFATGGEPLKDGLTGLAKITEKAAKYISDCGFKWNAEKFFGFNPAITGDTSKNFFDNLGKEFGKYTETGNTAQNVATAAKWAGALLTLGFNAYDNFTDEENTTFGRKLGETIGETAVSIGESAVISAAVTSVFAALGAVGAPAIAVGAATVGVTFLIDTGIEHLTGKKPSELISDFVLDEVVPCVGNAVQAVGDFVAEGVSKVTNVVADWWDSTTNALFSW